VNAASSTSGDDRPHDGPDDRPDDRPDDGADVDGALAPIDEVLPAALDGERLDRIVSLLTEASRADAAVLVAAGGASVDGTVVTVGKQRLAVGQRVVVDPSRLPQPVLPSADPTVDVAVIHADEHLVVIDKPAGLVVHPGAGNPTGTLVNGLLHRFPEIASVGEPGRPGIVHRLDVGTSGLLVVARTDAAHRALVAALARRDVGRGYRAFVWGHPANPHGVIDAPIGRDHRDPMRMAVVVDGKPARTHYRVDRRFVDPVEVAELGCRLETGRTHQIRVHLAAIGHPVVGDATYGGVRAGLSVGRAALHAETLSFTHPVEGRTMSFASSLPEDLLVLRDSLRERPDE
jgi:23S rRNA pseudouridine1911/1915/1917 synthase